MPLAPIATLGWDAGVLTAALPDRSVRTWTRPADLAATRLGLVPPPCALDLADGTDVLTAAFAVLPFVQGPLPEPVFGTAVTPAARAAFELFRDAEGGDLCVLRGELDDFLVFARRDGDVWRVGAFVAAATTLTVRYEDLWRRLPVSHRPAVCRVDVIRDPHAKDASAAQAAGVVRETIDGLAPDVRICLDVAASGGFLLTFRPMTRTMAGASCPDL